MKPDYDKSNTGREAYVTSNGRTIQRKYFYYSVAEWNTLYALSKDKGVSLGKMLMDLALAERDRRQSHYQRRIERLQ